MKNHAFRTFGLLVAALGCLTLAARGQTAVTETLAFLELPAEPGVFSAVGQNQSSTRAIDGDWLFLSTVVTWEGEPQTSGFILKVFRRSDDGWAYFQDIRSPDPEYSYWGSLDSFGARFVVKDQMVCVSAATYSDHGRILGGNGRVYVYAFDGVQWTYKQALRPIDFPVSPLASPNWVSSHYASALSFDGHRLVVGAMGQWPAGNDRYGLAYVYERQANDTFAFDALLAPPSLAQSGGYEVQFGRRVYVAGDRILVSTESDQATVRLYERGASGWSVGAEFQVPQYPDFWSGEQWWGHSLAMDGDRIAIGSLREDALSSSPTDFIRVYRESTPGNWVLEQTLIVQGPGLNPSDSPEFGWDIVMQGDWMLVGARSADPGYTADPPYNRPGRAFLYYRDTGNGWTLVRDFANEYALVPGRPQRFNLFGDSVSADWENGRLLITCPGYLTPGPQGSDTFYWGAVFLYDLELGSHLCDPETPNLTGSPSGLTVTGSLSVAKNNLLLHGHHLPPGSWGMFLVGQATGPIPMLTGGDLCIGGPLGAQRAITPNPVPFHGELYHQVDLQSAFALAHMLPGTSWSFQLIHRSYGNLTNTSNAVEVVLEP